MRPILITAFAILVTIPTLSTRAAAPDADLIREEKTTGAPEESPPAAPEASEEAAASDETPTAEAPVKEAPIPASAKRPGAPKKMGKASKSKPAKAGGVPGSTRWRGRACLPDGPCEKRLHRSQQSGAWDDPKTWDTGVVPGQCDRVIVSHEVEASGCHGVGDSPGAFFPGKTEPVLHVRLGGHLRIADGGTLVVRGDVRNQGVLQVDGGGELQFDSSQAELPRATRYRLAVETTWGKETVAHLRLSGTPGKRARLTSHWRGTPAQILPVYDTDALPVDVGTPGGGRIIGSYCDIERFGNEKHPGWYFRADVAGTEVRLSHCRFKKMGEIKQNYLAGEGAVLSFEKNIWRRSIPQRDRVSIFTPQGAPGAHVTIRGNRFDRQVYLMASEGAIIEDNVFAGGLVVHPNLPHAGIWASFRHNVIRQGSEGTAGFGLKYGARLEDNLYIMDFRGWNPHFLTVRHGTGETIVRGNIFWFTGPGDPQPAAEGDGIIVDNPDEGSREQNHVLVERNIFMPNANGPSGVNNLTSTIITVLEPSLDKRITVRRNTAFTNPMGGCNIGETGATKAGNLAYVKSNLFVGDGRGAGYKIRNLGKAEPDAIQPQDADYNACFRCSRGDNVGGLGYEKLKFSDNRQVGQNDLDGVNPFFVDWHRTPKSWDQRLGGKGSVMGALRRIQPMGRHRVADLLNYLREGFRPKNQRLAGAGDPAEGKPDIGAVDLNKLARGPKQAPQEEIR